MRKRGVDDGGQLPLAEHQDEPEEAGDDAGVREYFFQRFFSVPAASENCQSRGPHHDALRNEKDRCQQQAGIAEHALGKGVAEETRVGADDAVLEAFLTVGLVAAVDDFAEHDAKHLQEDGQNQDVKALPEDVAGKINQKGFDNVAGKHQVNDQVGQVFLPLFRNDAELDKKPADKYQEEHRSL